MVSNIAPITLPFNIDTCNKNRRPLNLGQLSLWTCCQPSWMAVITNSNENYSISDSNHCSSAILIQSLLLSLVGLESISQCATPPMIDRQSNSLSHSSPEETIYHYISYDMNLMKSTKWQSFLILFNLKYSSVGQCQQLTDIFEKIYKLLDVCSWNLFHGSCSWWMKIIELQRVKNSVLFEISLNNTNLTFLIFGNDCNIGNNMTTEQILHSKVSSSQTGIVSFPMFVLRLQSI